MTLLRVQGRQLGERFTKEKLADLAADAIPAESVNELREAALSWIEHQTERKIRTRELLETL